MSDTLRQLVERVEHTAEGDYFNRGQHIPANCLRCAFEAFLAQPCGSLGEMAEKWESATTGYGIHPTSQRSLTNGELDVARACAEELRDWLARQAKLPLVQAIREAIIKLYTECQPGFRPLRPALDSAIAAVLAAQPPQLTEQQVR